jgi:hypothetical protein
MSLNYRTENALLPVACNQRYISPCIFFIFTFKCSSSLCLFGWCANIIFSKLTVAPAQATSHLAAGAVIDFSSFVQMQHKKRAKSIYTLKS